MTEVARPGEAAELSEAADETDAATAQAAEESEAAPTTVDVICGTMRAKFLVDSWRVVVDGAHASAGRLLTCTVKDESPNGPGKHARCALCLPETLNMSHSKLVHLATCGVQRLRTPLPSLSVRAPVCPCFGPCPLLYDRQHSNS